MAKKPKKPKPEKKPEILRQSEMLIALAKREGCTVLKVGEFYVQFGAAAGEPHDQVGFDLSPTQDPFTEDADHE